MSCPSFLWWFLYPLYLRSSTSLLTLLFWGKTSSSSFPKKNTKQIHFVVQPQQLKAHAEIQLDSLRFTLSKLFLSLLSEKGRTVTYEMIEEDKSESLCFPYLFTSTFIVSYGYWFLSLLRIGLKVTSSHFGALDLIWLKSTSWVSIHPSFFLFSNAIAVVSFPIVLVLRISTCLFVSN